jgi:hypothetical protein
MMFAIPPYIPPMVPPGYALSPSSRDARGDGHGGGLEARPLLRDGFVSTLGRTRPAAACGMRAAGLALNDEAKERKSERSQRARGAKFCANSRTASEESAQTRAARQNFADELSRFDEIPAWVAHGLAELERLGGPPGGRFWGAEI